MAAPSVFSMETFPLMDDDVRSSAAPQLVMLANVAAVAAVDGGGALAEGSVADDKEMMELKTVPCGYSDSEDESVVRYGYDNRDVCVNYAEAPGLDATRGQNGGREDDGEFPPAKSSGPVPPPHKDAPAAPAVPAPPPHKDAPPAPAVPAEGPKKKKPFHCKPCHFQAHDEKGFVDHLRTHAVSKMAVVNRVEGRSRLKAKEAQTAPDGRGEDATATAGDAKGLIRCERCGYNTNRYDHYVAHLKHHSKDGQDHRVFKCTLCAYSTVSQYHWRKHLRNHFPSKLHTCTQCSYFSDRKSNYIQHIRTHTGVRPFQCPYCDYSSSQKTHLTRHMRTHSGERPFKCESCNYLAANQHEVTRHARQVHNGPKPLACPYCEYKTADRSNFKKHVELHLNPRQFLCPLCKYAASKKCNLQYHIKSRHSGCNVTVDVSKVKLRVKKPEEPSKTNLSGGEEDCDGEEADKEPVPRDKPSGPIKEPIPRDKPSGPINLSVRKSGKPRQSEDEPEVSPGESNGSAVKVEQEKTITTRQKKSKENQEDVVRVVKAKRRVKKTMTDKPSDLEATKDKREKLEVEGTAGQHAGNERGKPRRSGSKKSEQEDPTPQGLQKDAKKRKAVQALNISGAPTSKVRRLRTSNKSNPTSKYKHGSNVPPSSSLPTKRARRSTRKPLADQPESQPGVPDVPESSTRPVESTAAPVKATKPFVRTEESPADGAADATPAPPTPAKASPLPPESLPGSSCKALDLEDDEGVHSSHEGGGDCGNVSDNSDGASEGSDDSGLNGNGAEKMATDPETPTHEIPTPTELKSHVCIFCDRHFPVEAEYRRHLNRHLVNVYYMDATPTGN
ncbi:RE1-silencing transcription factor [Syngnathoides biaculeatus]|uniref:RE1-silencing transcription factor n=1 Tax=Syngnathoides biaculeatus TaxID=300417 RepID=UPI002ADDA14F|nr:RE1-silencing transcription factor [Syngnathoides biaculeatus]XP_061690400.1 RE1-silencing transcription factor [Syngnathoides biaculeatus]